MDRQYHNEWQRKLDFLSSISQIAAGCRLCDTEFIIPEAAGCNRRRSGDRVMTPVRPPEEEGLAEVDPEQECHQHGRQQDSSDLVEDDQQLEVQSRDGAAEGDEQM